MLKIAGQLNLNDPSLLDLIDTLNNRFVQNKQRHADIDWQMVLARINSNKEKLVCLYEMERTGGEPDVIEMDSETGEIIFYDCSAESPAGRRSLCYDKAGWDSRKDNKPIGSAMEMACQMGIEMLNEQQYLKLQSIGKFDTKTSSWICTPEPMRNLDGALFGDCRYNRVFFYHNGASSYYGARGFRGLVKV